MITLSSRLLLKAPCRHDLHPISADYLADSLGKGDRVMVTGRLRQRSWRPRRVTSGR